MNNNVKAAYIGDFYTLIQFTEPYSLTGSFKTLAGNKIYFLNGKFHREDGPAVEWANGYRAWYLNGKPHRVDGPAVEASDGYRAWFLNGKRHRIDGPAIECANGTKCWYLNDKKYTEVEYNRQMKAKI